MKKIIVLFIVSVLMISCDTFNINPTDYGKLSFGNKQLTGIIQNGKLTTEIKYDSKNRIYEINRYYEGKISGKETFKYNSSNQVIEHISNETRIDYYTYKDGKLSEMLSVNTPNPDWKIKLVYKYHNNRIESADKYSEDKLIAKIQFEYDKNGNTTSRKEISGSYVNEEYRCTYDEKPNPFHDPMYYPLDIIQKNNIITTFHYAVFMSSLPTEFGIEYTYNSGKCPTTAIKRNMTYPAYETDSFTYIYK